MPRIAVKDGLTRTETLTVENDSCQVTFRPATTVAAIAHDDYYKVDGPKRASMLIDLIVGHVVDWNFTDEDGKPLSPTDRKIVGKIPFPYLLAMQDAILKAAYETGIVVGN